MSTKDQPLNLHRRQFFATVGAAAGTVALAGLVAKQATAADLPHLTEDDATAKNMGYREDTAKVDAKKYANHKAEQSCANCQFYQGPASGYGPCQIFAGKAVSSKGWCQVWAKKA